MVSAAAIIGHPQSRGSTCPRLFFLRGFRFRHSLATFPTWHKRVGEKAMSDDIEGKWEIRWRITKRVLAWTFAILVILLFAVWRGSEWWGAPPSRWELTAILALPL